MINEDIRLNISLWFCNLKNWCLKIVQRYSFSLFDACTYPVSMTHFVLRENHIWRDMWKLCSFVTHFLTFFFFLMSYFLIYFRIYRGWKYMVNVYKHRKLNPADLARERWHHDTLVLLLLIIGNEPNYCMHPPDKMAQTKTYSQEKHKRLNNR